MVIDAAEGICENSRRHGYMLKMLGIRQVAVLVNKMEQYNWQLVENVNNMIRRIDQRREAAQERSNRIPTWLKLLLAVSLTIITVCSVVTMVATVALFK